MILVHLRRIRAHRCIKGKMRCLVFFCGAGVRLGRPNTTDLQLFRVFAGISSSPQVMIFTCLVGDFFWILPWEITIKATLNFISPRKRMTTTTTKCVSRRGVCFRNHLADSAGTPWWFWDTTWKSTCVCLVGCLVECKVGRKKQLQMEWNGAPISRVQFHPRKTQLFSAICRC